MERSAYICKRVPHIESVQRMTIISCYVHFILHSYLEPNFKAIYFSILWICGAGALLYVLLFWTICLDYTILKIVPYFFTQLLISFLYATLLEFRVFFILLLVPYSVLLFNHKRSFPLHHLYLFANWSIYQPIRCLPHKHCVQLFISFMQAYVRVRVWLCICENADMNRLLQNNYIYATTWPIHLAGDVHHKRKSIT